MGISDIAVHYFRYNRLYIFPIYLIMIKFVHYAKKHNKMSYMLPHPDLRAHFVCAKFHKFASVFQFSLLLAFNSKKVQKFVCLFI